MSRRISGIVPIVAAAFTDSGTLDDDSFQSLVRHLMKTGASALTLFGRATEFYKLTDSDRAHMQELLLKETRRSESVAGIISVTDHSWEVAVRRARDGEAQGADALMLLPPYFLGPGEDAILDHLKRVVGSVKIPVIVQYAPCAYCDFNTYAGQEDMIPVYMDALCKEIEFVGARFPSPSGREARDESKVHTIFFGGGTPSLLSPPQFDSIFKSIRSAFALTSDAEISIEANPGTVTYESLCQLREIGINRISYGVQSANAFELKMLERAHNFFDVIDAVTSARKADFDNLNLDLIYGLPEQTLETWQTTVKRILNLYPEHISAYALTLEHGTPFGKWSSKGLLPLPDPDLAAEMYEWLSDVLEVNGYVQYEISNWAKIKDKASRENPHPSPR